MRKKILKVKRKLTKLHLHSIKLTRFSNSEKMRLLDRKSLTQSLLLLEGQELLLGQRCSSMETLDKVVSRQLVMVMEMQEGLSSKRLHSRCSSDETKMRLR